MIKRINDFLAGWPMTLVGGAFLVASFILPRVGYPAGERLALACVFICGLPLLYLAAWRVIYNKGISKISSALLISMTMIAAMLIGDLFAAGEVAFIMEIGALLEDMTTERARKGLKKLLSLSPETGRVVREGKEAVVPVGQVAVGDIVRVLPGETIPVDGVIVSGAIALSMGINFVAIALSVMGVLNPTTGALAHNAGSCLVVLLAALLYDRRCPFTDGEANL